MSPITSGTNAYLKMLSRGRHAFGAVLGLVLLGVVAGACSSQPSASPIASLPAHGGATSTTVAPTLGQQDAALVSYARCLRRHGINEPDPFQRPGHVGLTISVPPPSAAFTRADAACGHTLSHLIQRKEAHQSAIGQSLNLSALTRYAHCMRAHDISMLDPNQYGGLDLGNVPGINNDFGRYSPQFRSADSACRHLLPAGTHDDGSGP